MLRAFLLSNIFIVWSSLIFAQKRDNVWMLGAMSNFNNYGIEFNPGQADTFSIHRYLNFIGTNSSICDTNGQILFYTNGITILNRNNDTLLNAYGFNPGFFTSNYANFGLPLYYSSLIIPRPNYESQYFYLIHESAEVVTYNSVQSPHPISLRYSEIDMSLDNGLGGIILGKKNIHLVNDTLIRGRVSAVKHGNGRDWWILCHRFNSNSYYRFLLTQDSIVNLGIQNIGAFNPHQNAFGQSVFSLDGNQYMSQIDDTTVDVYDFDRCTGMLSNARSISINEYTAALVGCAFSPNGRYIYINNELNLRQYDTQAPNIWASEQLIAPWDTFYSPGPTTFGNMKLGPDGIIYMNTTVGTNMLHLILNPDSPGVACNFIQDNFLTPSYNTYGFPNSPNWDLVPSNGSICDSLFNNVGMNNEDNLEFEIYPNPARNNFSVRSSKKIIKTTAFLLYDNLGKEKIKSSLNSSFQNYEFDSGNLNDGIYFYLIRTPEEILKSGKLIIAK